MRYQIYLYRAPGGTQLNQSLSPFPLLSLILHLTISLFSIFSILLNVYGGWFLVQLNSWNNNAQFTTCHGNQKRIFLLEVPKGPSLCKQRGNWTSLLVVKAHNFLLIFWIPNGAHLSNKYNFFFFLFQVLITLLVFLHYSSWPLSPKKHSYFCSSHFAIQ